MSGDCFIVSSAFPTIFNVMLVKYHKMYLVVTCQLMGEGMVYTITPSCCNSSLPFQESPDIFKQHPLRPPSSLCMVLVGVGASLPQWTLLVPDIPSLHICKEVGTVLLPCSSQLPGSLLFLSQSLWPPLTLWLPYSLSKILFIWSFPGSFYDACNQGYWESQYLFRKDNGHLLKVILILQTLDSL